MKQIRISRSACRVLALAIAVLVALATACAAQQAAPTPRDPHGPRDVEAHIRRLEKPERDEYQKPDEVVRALDLSKDAWVADVGCGPGYFTRRLAPLVPGGVVFGVDIEPLMLDRLAEHVRADGLENVVPVLASRHDPFLPPGRFDLILVVDTYHHFDDREAYLEKLARGLAPGGRLVIIDYFKRKLPVGPPVDHKMSRLQVLREVKKAGFRLVDEPKLLPYQYFLVFSRS